MQKAAKHRRQVFITTHSNALLSDTSIDPAEVIRLEITSDGTIIGKMSETDINLIKSGYSIAEVLLQKIKPSNLDQLGLFGS